MPGTRSRIRRKHPTHPRSGKVRAPAAPMESASGQLPPAERPGPASPSARSGRTSPVEVGPGGRECRERRSRPAAQPGMRLAMAAAPSAAPPGRAVASPTGTARAEIQYPGVRDNPPPLVAVGSASPTTDLPGGWRRVAAARTGLPAVGHRHPGRDGWRSARIRLCRVCGGR